MRARAVLAAMTCGKKVLADWRALRNDPSGEGWRVGMEGGDGGLSSQHPMLWEGISSVWIRDETLHWSDGFSEARFAVKCRQTARKGFELWL